MTFEENIGFSSNGIIFVHRGHLRLAEWVKLIKEFKLKSAYRHNLSRFICYWHWLCDSSFEKIWELPEGWRKLVKIGEGVENRKGNQNFKSPACHQITSHSGSNKWSLVMRSLGREPLIQQMSVQQIKMKDTERLRRIGNATRALSKLDWSPRLVLS